MSKFRGEVPPPPQQTVAVEFDAARFTLRVSPGDLFLVPGTRVVWDFSNLPEGFFPWIRFEGDREGFGPFPSISQLSDSLLGELPEEAPGGQYQYRLLLRSRTGQHAQAGHATIWSAEQTFSVGGQMKRTTSGVPMVTVAADGGSALELSPQVVTLTSASDVLVGFAFDSAILADGSGALEPRIEFIGYTPPNGPTRKPPALGPFSALIFDGTTIWGTGDAGLRGIFNYQALALRQSTGEVVWASSPDPFIDDQREPPP